MVFCWLFWKLTFHRKCMDVSTARYSLLSVSRMRIIFRSCLFRKICNFPRKLHILTLSGIKHKTNTITRLLKNSNTLWNDYIWTASTWSYLISYRRRESSYVQHWLCCCTETLVMALIHHWFIISWWIRRFNGRFESFEWGNLYGTGLDINRSIVYVVWIPNIAININQIAFIWKQTTRDINSGKTY